MTDFSICFDTSLGLGQVRISTAKLMQDLGYMPMVEGRMVPINGIRGTRYVSREEATADLLLNPATNIMYIAAYIAYIIDMWICGHQNTRIYIQI